MKIVDYAVVQASSNNSLAARIRNYIQDGWQPLGGVSVDCDDYCHQAIVKYEEPKEPENKLL